MKRLLTAAMLLMATCAFGQQTVDRDSNSVIPAASGTTITFLNRTGTNGYALEYLFTGSPTTASVVLSGCMRGGTCTLVETSTLTSNALHFVVGTYDFITIVPTFTGGTSPKLQVNMTGISQSYPAQQPDPCQGQANAKTFLNINQAASTRLVIGSAGKKLTICGWAISQIGVATNIALVEGAGATCGTNTVALPGGTGGDGTAAKGAILAVGASINSGNGGYAVGQQSTAGDDTCLLQSAGNQISGTLVFVLQ